MDANLEVGTRRSEGQDQPLPLFGYCETVGEQPPKTRILVLDEQPLLRHGISVYLNSQPDMMVCGETGSISDAPSKIAECQPQLLLTALRLGAQDSLKLIKQLKAKNAALRILVYSAYDENIFAERAMRAGASGYVMKQAPTEKMTAAIRDVMGGGIYVSREVALGAFRKSLRRARKKNYPLRSGNRLEDLSDREMHIFQLIGSGLSTKQMAQSLKLSVKTVESHRDNIKRKLHLSSGEELRERAAKWVVQSLAAEAHVFRSAS
jgi:DNA-binding NarL/FixJ family response regulator